LGQQHRASLLATVSLILTLFMAVGALAGFILRANRDFASLIMAGGLLIAYLLARSKYYRLGSVILIMVFLAFTVYRSATSSSSLADILYSFLPMVFILSIALYNQRGIWVLFGAVMAGLAVIFWQRETEFRFIVQYIGVTASLAILAIIVMRFRDNIEQARVAELQAANRELMAIQASLEQRVQERTADLNARIAESERRAYQLEAVSKVARVIASVQDMERLLPTIAQVVSEQFGFYHTGIFLLDEKNEFAILQAASSEGGQNMLRRGHRLRLGASGIVGYVAAQNEPRIALDVGADAVYFNNPDLPNTRSEMALPLSVAGKTIGVLDVQSAETNAFKAEDISALTTLANQIAIAMENARLFSQTRQALNESRSVYEEFVKQEWSRFAQHISAPGYTYDGIKTTPLLSPPDNNDPQTIKAPVRIRGLVVGQVSIRSNDPARQWTQDEINLVQAAAERAGLAIENVRLLQEAQRRAAKEHTIGEISSRIGASIDINSIMQTAVEELGRVLPRSEIILQFQEKE
jgi:GAF domain-containing protein